MFDRFTADARRAVVLAQEEARREGAAELAPRHLALGALAQAPVDALLGEHARVLVDKLRRPESGAQPKGRIPFTASTKFALEQSLRLNLQFDHSGITSAHVLLGAATCADGDVEAALRLAGIDVATLLDAVRGLPDVPPDALTVDQLRRYLSVPGENPDSRRGFQRNLVDALLREGDLTEARRTALAHLADGNEHAASQLVAIGELTGDVGLILEHARAGLAAADGRPSYQASYGLALAHAGRFDEAEGELVAATAAAEGPIKAGAMLEHVAAKLLAGDVDGATQLFDAVPEPDAADTPWLRLLWMRLRLDVAHAHGEVIDVGPLPEAPSGIIDTHFRATVDVAQLRGALGRHKPSSVARAAARLAADAEKLEFRSIAAEAHAVRGSAWRAAGKRKWRSEVERAADAMEALGRTVIAERLRTGLDSE